MWRGGKRLNPRKADLQDWREGFARELQLEGVDAEATPRPSRGVVRKAENSIVRHIERGDERHPPRVPRVKALRVKEAAEELVAESNGQPVAAKPWEARIKERQETVRRAWLDAAEALTKDLLSFKDKQNERPDYGNLDADRVRTGQRAAALYQSDLEKSGRKASAAAVASLRDLSRFNVVQHERPTQLLLYKNAQARVGRHSSPDHEVRREGTGVAGPAGRIETLNFAQDDRSSRMSLKDLADRIPGFVGAMPAIDTERHELKRDLAGRFGRQVERGVEKEPVQQAVRTVEKGAEPSPPVEAKARSDEKSRITLCNSQQRT